MIERLVDKIFTSLYLRKIYHLGGGLLMVIALAQVERNLFILFGALYFLAFLVLAKRISFAVIGVTLLYLLTGSKNLTLYTTIIWLVGDGAAGLIGSALGKRKVPWNNQKTILGSTSFFLSSLAVLLALFILAVEEFNASLVILGVVTCLVACFIESLPVSFIRDRKPDDNFIILVLSGLTMWQASDLLGLGALLW